jgi:hypothetical protein
MMPPLPIPNTLIFALLSPDDKVTTLEALVSVGKEMSLLATEEYLGGVNIARRQDCLPLEVNVEDERSPEVPSLPFDLPLSS